MASTKLTHQGWIGLTSGKWSTSGNKTIVNKEEGIGMTTGIIAKTGEGSLHISGEGKTRDTGVALSGTLDCTEQKDGSKSTIQGTGGWSGVSFGGTILLGGGNDKITGIGQTHTGIGNYGLIKTGGGNDTLRGVGIIDTDPTREDFGIRNEGTILLGDGDDTVDALIGGLGGNGYIHFGGGTNMLKGFGKQTVYGGGSRESRILLNPGTYYIADQVDSGQHGDGTGAFAIKMKEDASAATMDVDGFGLIGGAEYQDGVLKIREGTLVITSDGSARYL